jgi:predicted DNA-binding transcriptional regulator AlpA
MGTSIHQSAGARKSKRERNMTSRASQTIEPFVGTREVAEMLGKPESWLYNRADELGIPRYKVGLIWRYRLSEVEAWIRGAA